MLFEKGSVKKAKALSGKWINEKLSDCSEFVLLGLPEYDDRHEIWRVPLKLKNDKNRLIGEINIDQQLTKIIDSTDTKIIKSRVNKYKDTKPKKRKTKAKRFYPAAIPNKVILGDSVDVLEDFPPDTAQLVFTSPPYFNAKPEYSEYVDYQEYLDFIRKVIKRTHSILSEGRFFVINVSPILIRRTSRNTSSKRIPIPFDFHKIFDSVGFEFIDDIIWVKPEGAGWNLGRGRRFAADRQPLQYKPVPVTEYIIVYRKKTDKLIDWNLRKHHDPNLVEESKILGDYDVTNVWEIHPGHSKIHPAVFPLELAKKVIRYYSFKDDLVLDPFAGIGTVGEAAHELNRRFLLIDNEPKYFDYMKQNKKKLFPEIKRVDFDIHERFRNGY